MARYQAGPPALPLAPPPQPFWQASQAGPSHAHGYSQAPQPAGGFMDQQLGPPPHQLPLAGGDDRLRSVDELPPCFRSVFPFRYFNAIQNECWPTIYEAGHNVVIAAPTGGGKTVLLELAILRLLSSHITPGGQWVHKPGHLKSVYLAPSRALVQEKVRDWTQRFGALGITCRELTGDTDHEGLEGLDSADIICATPEKFDAVTRSGMRFFADIGLVLIDEVHLLNENRGSSLEGVVARIKVVSRLREMREQAIGSVRYVAVSATIPNVRDLAEWLGAPPNGIKCFGEEMRPVKLRTVVRGYQPTKTDFLFERRLNDYIFQIVSEFSSGKPSLVFCSSRRGTSETAAALAKAAAQAAGGGRPSVFVRDPAKHARLVAAAAKLGDTHLRECVQLGVGYHHAAMEPEERAAVEAIFSAQDLPVLCTTSTLAMGVNLPARLVVIKGTRRYIGSEAEDPSGYQEYERSTCLQMVGRAGRPQFDTEGVAVIMTQKAHVRRYEQLTSGSELVESMIKEVLPELLNAEITLRTITDVAQAVTWLRSTYFYVRVKRDPGRYDVPRQPTTEALDHWLRDRLLMGCLRELAEHGMVRLHDDGMGLEPLRPGIIMAEKYVRMATMKSLTGAPQGAGISDLISIVARSAELANIKLRRSEKKLLNEVNHSDRVRYPLMNPAKPGKLLERVATGADKIYVLVNEGLADTPTDKLEYSLRQDVEQAVAVGKRLAGAMVRFFEHEGRASETFNALLLSKSLRQRMWTDSAVETRQLAGIGPQIAQRLAAAGVSKLAQLAKIDARRLENLAQRHYPFGNEVHAVLAKCLPPEVKLQCLPVSWLPGGLVELEITVERVDRSDAPSPCRLLVGSLHDNALLLCRTLALDSFPSPLVLRTRTRSAVKGRGTSIQVVASIVHERLVGVDSAIKVVVPPGVQLQARTFLPLVKQEQPHKQQQEQQGGPADEGSVADEGAPDETVHGDPAAGQAKPARAEASTAGALQLIQHRMAGARQGAPLLPYPTPAPDGAAAAAGAPAVAPTPPLPPASGGMGRWSTFVAAPVEGGAGSAGPKPGSGLKQQSIQAALRLGAAKAQAAQAGRPPLSSRQQPQTAQQQQTAGADTPDNSTGFVACQPPQLGPAAQPGGLFSQFALGSSAKAAAPALNAGGSAGQRAWGLLDSSTGAPHAAVLGQAQQAAQDGTAQARPSGPGQAAPAKRRRLQSLFPSPGAPDPGALPPLLDPTNAPAAAAAAPPLVPVAALPSEPAAGKRTLNLPKLGFLTGRFAARPAAVGSQGAAAAAAAAALPAVAPAEQARLLVSAAAPAQQPDLAAAFSFL